MNPLISLLLIALAAFTVIVLLALIPTLIILHYSKRYDRRQREIQTAQILQLLPGLACEGCDGCAAFALKLLDGEISLADCGEIPREKAEKLQLLLDNYKQEQERIHKAAESNQKKRPRRHRVRALLMEKREKGEW